MSAAKNLRVSAAESVGIYKLGQDTDVACASISVDVYRIDGVNNITQLKNMDSIELKTEFGFDKPLDCALFAENSPELSELIITNGNLSNVESLASLHNLKTLMLTDTDIKNTAWAEALSGDIEHMIIMEYGKALVKNVFED